MLCGFDYHWSYFLAKSTISNSPDSEINLSFGPFWHMFGNSHDEFSREIEDNSFFKLSFLIFVNYRCMKVLRCSNANVAFIIWFIHDRSSINPKRLGRVNLTSPVVFPKICFSERIGKLTPPRKKLPSKSSALLELNQFEPTICQNQINVGS